MKKSVTVALLGLATSAQAHPSLIPHEHPHATSMLPDVGMLVVASIVLFSGALLAYAKWRGE
jgi:hypothetical protein